jgi:excisionase family DNA binding protein
MMNKQTAMPSGDQIGKRAPLTVDELRQRPTVSVVEAAQVLGISKGLAYEMVKDGRLDSIEFGPKRWRVPSASLLKMLRVEVRP